MAYKINIELFGDVSYDCDSEDIEGAKQKAADIIDNIDSFADHGELEIIDFCYPVAKIYDENGNFITEVKLDI